MDVALEQLSKPELIALLKQQEQAAKEHQKNSSILQQENTYLKSQVELLKRLQFGQKRERFEGDPAQGLLPFEAPAEEVAVQEEEIKEQITYTRKKQSAHKGRAALPAHLPVEEVEIYPEGDLTEMTCIGKEVTEELECEPARFFIRRYIRYKYAAKSGEGVLKGDLPERVIDKGIPGAGLLSMILTDKYVDHLPLYRQKQRFARENIPIASSTIEGWVKQALERLEPLYQQLKFDIKAKGYLQVDETSIKVLENDKKGATHMGWYWVYHSPMDGLVLMDYQPTRGSIATKEMLAQFSGYLQSDGYAVYEKIGQRNNVTPVACWAHARREFERALENDKSRASKALNLIQTLYAVERKAKEEELSPEQIKVLRLDEALPVINELGKWIFNEVKSTLPKSQIGKAMRYAMERWDKLSAYLQDGSLLIDNNLIENAIRPIALGRKNYLFAGTHDAAAKAGMLYSFLAICKKHDVNPVQWLKYTLQNIMTINHKDIRNLYPQNYKKLIEAGKM
jgi:transposase